MVTVNIHEAKTHLSRLVEQVAKGREFVIAKAGRRDGARRSARGAAGGAGAWILVGQGMVEIDVKAGSADDVQAMFERGGRRAVMFLLDTQLVLQAAYTPERLSRQASRLLCSREVPLACSLAWFWEVTIKTSLGRAGFSADPRGLH